MNQNFHKNQNHIVQSTESLTEDENPKKSKNLKNPKKVETVEKVKKTPKKRNGTKISTKNA